MRESAVMSVTRKVLLAVALLAAPLGWAGATESHGPTPPVAAKAKETQVQATTPPFSDGIYPCSTCHDGKEKVNTQRRRLQFHDEQQDVLAHGEERWCLDCHDAQRRDVLRSASGQPIPFTESYRLCGQCHGKRVGQWNGAKTYFLCVNCHNPHTPRWKGITDVVVDGQRIVSPTLQLIKPEPRPKRPEEMRP